MTGSATMTGCVHACVVITIKTIPISADLPVSVLLTRFLSYITIGIVFSNSRMWGVDTIDHSQATVTFCRTGSLLQSDRMNIVPSIANWYNAV